MLLAETSGEIGTHRPEVMEGIRSVPTPPYVVYFRYGNGAAEVARILHERQDVERHLG